MRDANSEKQITPSRAADILTGIYPAITASDPKVYLAALVSLFSNYPPRLLRAAIDPLTGLPGKYDFPPTIKQAKEFLDRAAFEDRQHQLRVERANAPRLPEPDPDPEMRKRIAEQFRDLSNQLKAGIGPSQI